MRVVLDPFELAWAAGFFDAERFTLLRNRPGGYLSPRVSITQARREPLDRFASAVGLGSVRGPYQSGDHTPMYHWEVSGRKGVARVLNLLWPHLSLPKRQQAAGKWEELRLGTKRELPEVVW